jgi:very-short-patch-repair endonuclease
MWACANEASRTGYAAGGSSVFTAVFTHTVMTGCVSRAIGSPRSWRAGPGAALSYRSAGQLCELRQSNSALIDVTVPSRNGRIRRAGIRIHRALIAVVQNNPGRRTAKLMTAAEAKHHRTRSPLEDRFLRFKDKYGVEEPDSGVWIEGYELDFVWTRVGLAVELDGHAAHTTRRAFSADRLRDRVLWRRGIRTMRLTDDAFDAEEEILADLVQAGVSVASWPRASSYSPPRRSRISSARAM